MFEVKYDKNGLPIKEDKAFQEQEYKESIQEDVSKPEISVQEDNQEIQQEQVVSSQIEQSLVKDDTKEANFRAMRDKLQRAERERDEALRLAQQVQKEKEKQLAKLNPDDLVEGKHINELQDDVKALRSQIEYYQTEARIKSQYPDIDQVVNADSIARLKEEHPDIAEAIASTSDYYKKASVAYKMIKQLNLSQQSPSNDQERQIAQRNSAKPKPINTIAPQQGDTPLTKANAFANGLTKELREQLRREMEDARRNL